MIEIIEMKDGFKRITSTTGLIHKKGTDVDRSNLTMLPGETIDMYEEVMEKPPYTEEEYKQKVAKLIHERYGADEETSLINNMLDDNPTEDHIAEYRAYQAYRAECKARAKEMLENRDPEGDNVLT